MRELGKLMKLERMKESEGSEVEVVGSSILE
jgi:hypothetical protein